MGLIQEGRMAKPGKIFFCVITLSFLLVFPLSLHCQKNSCLECHKEMDEESLRAPVEGFAKDIHGQFGLSCQDCHGGNPLQDDVELAKDKSFKGAPQKAKIPEFCGSCHANSEYMKRFNPNLRVDQLQLYWTSKHGELLRKGDTHVAVCTDCHGVHGIQASNFPKSSTFAWNIPQTCGRCHSSRDDMKAYGIPVNQVEDYKQSVHAQALYEKKDLSAPVCNDCHGNHGASPPQVTSIAFVCRQCHPSAGDLFSQSPHKAAFDGLGISECEACHGNHKILLPTDEMLSGGRSDVCSQCHDLGTGPYETGLQMKRQLDSYAGSFASVQDLLTQAKKHGVEVSEPEYRLQDASTTLILVRNLTHALSLPDMEEKLGEGTKVIASVKARGEAALEEAKFRKTGLVIATGFIFLLALALYLKIRELQSKPAS
jgi:predicted CXXCH cytochrome family protein